MGADRLQRSECTLGIRLGGGRAARIRTMDYEMRRTAYADEMSINAAGASSTTVPNLAVTEFTERVRASRSREDLRLLIRDQVVHRSPYAFQYETDLYAEVQAHLARQLGSGADSVGLVGSAATGFSIAPDNYSRPLLESSDLDFVVVSAELFDKVWHSLLRWGHPIRNRVPREVQSWFDDRTQEIFWGWLDPERLTFRGVTRPSILRDVKRLKETWFETFHSLGNAFPQTQIATRPVSARLYRSVEHLVEYQVNGLWRVRTRLNEGERP